MGGDIEPELKTIADLSKVVIIRRDIDIYIPIFERWYVKTYSSMYDFTLRKLIRLIKKIGEQAGIYDTHHYPEHYMDDNPAPADFLGNFALVSNHNNSGIMISGRRVYVSFDS